MKEKVLQALFVAAGTFLGAKAGSIWFWPVEYSFSLTTAAITAMAFAIGAAAAGYTISLFRKRTVKYWEDAAIGAAGILLGFLLFSIT